MKKAFALLFFLQLLLPVFGKGTYAGEITLTIGNIAKLVKAKLKKESLSPVYYEVFDEAGQVSWGFVQSADEDQVYTIFIKQRIREASTLIDLRLLKKGQKEPLAKQVVSSRAGSLIDEAIARKAIKLLVEELKADRE